MNIIFIFRNFLNELRKYGKTINGYNDTAFTLPREIVGFNNEGSMNLLIKQEEDIIKYLDHAFEIKLEVTFNCLSARYLISVMFTLIFLP